MTASTPEPLTGAEVSALRAVAEGACKPMTCGGHRSMGSLIRCAECSTRADASSQLAKELTPRTVLRLLALAEDHARLVGVVAAVREAIDPGELECGRLGLTCLDVNPPDRWCRACRLRAALDTTATEEGA